MTQPQAQQKMPTPQSLKEAVVAAARKATIKHFPQYASPERASGACLYFTYFLLMEGRLRGVELVPQAGSVFWRRMTQEQDDGVSPLFFGYEWSPETVLSKIAVAHGALPEIHIWAACVQTQEIVDIQTGLLPLACKRVLGVEWLAPPPPDFLWTPVTELQEHSRYEPNKEATLYAWAAMQESVQKKIRGYHG
jgi:hypothetical protein